MRAFDAIYRRRARLATFLDGVRAQYPAYFARPVPPVGTISALDEWFHY